MKEQDQNKTKNQQPLDTNLDIKAKFSSLGFKQLTPIQKKAIPTIFQKKILLLLHQLAQARQNVL